jgi:hypothetical protein
MYIMPNFMLLMSPVLKSIIPTIQYIQNSAIKIVIIFKYLKFINIF